MEFLLGPQIIPGSPSTAVWPGREIILPGEFLANKKCLDKMPYKIVNISSMWDHVGKWNVLAWSALETGSDGVIFGFWPKQVFLAVSEGPWNQYKCDICTHCERFPTEIAEHMLSQHPGRECIRCNRCKQTVIFRNNPKQFEEHVR